MSDSFDTERGPKDRVKRDFWFVAERRDATAMPAAGRADDIVACGVLLELKAPRSGLAVFEMDCQEVVRRRRIGIHIKDCLERCITASHHSLPLEHPGFVLGGERRLARIDIHEFRNPSIGEREYKIVPFIHRVRTTARLSSLREVESEQLRREVDIASVPQTKVCMGIDMHDLKWSFQETARDPLFPDKKRFVVLRDLTAKHWMTATQRTLLFEEESDIDFGGNVLCSAVGHPLVSPPRRPMGGRPYEEIKIQVKYHIHMTIPRVQCGGLSVQP